MKSNREFKQFERIMSEILKTGHDELKARLELESERKAKKRKKSRKSSASRVANAKS